VGHLGCGGLVDQSAPAQVREQSRHTSQVRTTGRVDACP
jgi:hypothetical protein